MALITVLVFPGVERRYAAGKAAGVMPRAVMRSAEPRSVPESPAAPRDRPEPSTGRQPTR